MKYIETPDGSLTAFSERFGQAYSSVHGARSQATTVFVEGTGTRLHPDPRVLEVGFGLGHNFRATLASRAAHAPLSYLAFEFDPVARSVLERVSNEQDAFWQIVVRAWQPPLRVEDDGKSLEVRLEDVTNATLPEAWATAVYLDGFSPTANPDVWASPFLARLASSMASGGVLATYSSAGAVRRGLQGAGLIVEKRRGLRGKREFLVAVKP
ncbi:tRNA (5-methylaminomethyl-2-thiouridine)(34)-methyltransferase MnmD [Deinococcus yavapaiensis]|uniref:tRNA U34 5-methylaminomethyl-2-thiouridine-forming methyltransferase MnmC n=1 Tax=Deinococcus yavapaiensis KR-236 TaxID=694435 RepID=A0A318SAJ5_9DEIO|nr:tRNA (5-methylaminomethyl-2-thiouridine)(34)-methyltransferase MnmD [Deinococcus yavapaiensis]PYE56379.1 tRNA U34 5-methylaminomethyl-2-thiouridine-forming methyltransferase MnmC [Deinococcus yavapaiensis KR-236]